MKGISMFIRLVIFSLAFSCVFLCLAEDKEQKDKEKLSADTLAKMTYKELEKESFDSLNANKLDFSLKYFAEMLKRQKTKSSPDETKLGLIYYGQGKVFQKKGDFNKAIKNFDKALTLLKDKSISPEIKTSLYSCAGSAYSSNGNIKKALHWEEKAFELAKQTYGLESQWTSAYLACLATSYYENHDYSKAIKLLEQSYLILTKLNGANDKKTLRVKEKLEEWKKKISSDL
jgi:tetratricopeptide (TPR) repeat protein